MRWPWVSRLAYENATNTMEYFKEQNERLMDQMARMHRRLAGLPEVPRDARPPVEPMPESVLSYCNSLSNKAMQKVARDAAMKRHAAGEAWEAIMLDLHREPRNEEG